MATTPTAPPIRPARSMLIDVIRGMAIVLVVFGHCSEGIRHRVWWGPLMPFSGFMDQFIYSFHMPTFFFVSGIFLNASIEKRGPRRYAINRAGSLLYPYLLSGFFFQISPTLFARFMLEPQPNAHQILVNMLTGRASWFLPTLFFALMLAIPLRRLPLPAVFAASVLLQILWPHTSIDFLDRGITLLPFLILGMWVNRSFDRIERIPVPLALIVAALIAAVIWSIASSPYYGRPWLVVPLGIAGTLMLLLLARVLGRSTTSRAFAWAGEASLGIFILAAYLQGVARELIVHLLHTTAPWPHVILQTLFATVVSGLIYQYRVRLRINWIFTWPFGKQPA